MKHDELSEDKILEEEEDPLLETYKQTIRDIRYIYRKYGKSHPDAAWETINKLAHDPKLKMRSPAARLLKAQNRLLTGL